LLDCDPQEQFEKMLDACHDRKNLTVGEKSVLFGFFLGGWYGRTGEAAYQY